MRGEINKQGLLNFTSLPHTMITNQIGHTTYSSEQSKTSKKELLLKNLKLREDIIRLACVKHIASLEAFCTYEKWEAFFNSKIGS